MNEQATIIGKIKSMIFRSTDNGFSVLKLRLYELNEKDVFVTGYLPELPKDVLFEFEGNYIEHPRYGMQFSVSSYRRVLPSDKDSIVQYLSSPLFPKIGKKMAEKLVEVMGEDLLETIKQTQSIDVTIPGLTEEKKQIIIQGVCSTDDLEEAVRFFTTHGLGIRNIMKIDRIYGDKAMILIRENPYRLVEEVDGIGFITADKLALSMGFDENHPLRQEAAMVSMVMDACMRTGDTYITYEIIEQWIQSRFDFWVEDLDEILERCYRKATLVLDDQRIYHHTQYDAEVTISQFLSEFPLRPFEETEMDIETEIYEFEQTIQIEYDEIQRKAIHTFFSEDIMILTGGPGTGKTTIVRGIIEVAKRCYPQYEIITCAPTGRAAKRMKEITNTQSMTIHSLLKWDLESNTFGKNDAEPLLADILILDEFSMVDSWLFAQLCKASKYIRKICLIGDQDQLPSVGPGSVLRDLISSNRFTTVSLEHIYRQQEGSEVIRLAHYIRKGEFDVQHLHQDVRFYPFSPYEVKNGIMSIVEQALIKGYSPYDIQVLAAKYNGPAGIDTLNHSLQKLCNPPAVDKREMMIGHRLYREGDKILQLKNQPDDDVFNGDIGLLVEIIYNYEDENKQNRLIVDFDGIIVEYTSETFINITHAYCISVHKAQGSEYPIVIMPAILEYGGMLQRRLLYTGITRASRSLILIGQKRAFEKAVATVSIDERKTNLIPLMKQTPQKKL